MVSRLSSVDALSATITSTSSSAASGSTQLRRLARLLYETITTSTRGTRASVAQLPAADPSSEGCVLAAEATIRAFAMGAAPTCIGARRAVVIATAVLATVVVGVPASAANRSEQTGSAAISQELWPVEISRAYVRQATPAVLAKLKRAGVNAIVLDRRALTAKQVSAVSRNALRLGLLVLQTDAPSAACRPILARPAM